MSIKKTLTLLLLSTFSFTVLAQEEKEEKGTFSLSGTVDTYYSSNFSKNSLGSVGVLTDVPANGFGLGMVNTIFSYEKGKAGIVADLAYGPRANAANAYTGAINQLYAYYKASESVTITLGQFNTFLGYEVISPTGNFNYSVSYLFNAGPFSHTGIKLDYASSEDLSFMFAFTNPHAITAGANPTDDYQLGFQTGYKGQYLNLVYGAVAQGGPTDVFFIDYTGGFDLTDTFYFGINAAYSNSSKADAGYQGLALYLQNKFSEKFSLGLRPEFYTTTSGAGDANQSAFTLTGSTTLTDSLSLLTEVRYDTSNDVTFFGKNNVTGATIAAVYKF
ncbi:putative OmpL-like beta-barrel porin-2 [Lutibacter sp. Hel_I_33_5]|uniref:outer membrane beta-barrel protein n=1 Tax=Lutibacter sp. Hel_I_33_5 TaxID=1566289 RepID=UPI0011ACBF97|nr:outer membrane beta-barrel protein [Lutibacter sp. Hel_I_33_5]TVZ57282.1 putative OmpL-like beta-barrel porin-2 [Lutibacter sp. Hel_I_33_5]